MWGKVSGSKALTLPGPLPLPCRSSAPPPPPGGSELLPTADFLGTLVSPHHTGKCLRTGTLPYNPASAGEKTVQLLIQFKMGNFCFSRGSQRWLTTHFSVSPYLILEEGKTWNREHFWIDCSISWRFTSCVPVHTSL